jgi:beta-mannosidase
MGIIKQVIVKMSTLPLVQNLSEGWQFRQKGEIDWLSVTVPGCVHLDLLRHGRIPDPFFRDNEKKVQWVGYSDWEYRLKFSLEKSASAFNHALLIFSGLDTYATVFLNGKEIIRADNMFRPWSASVKDLLQEGDNEIFIVFHSPLLKEKEITKVLNFTLPALNDQAEGTSSCTRKAPYHYGWDWGPCLVTSGIWQPVKLIFWQNFRITHFSVDPMKVDKKRAIIQIGLEISAKLNMAVDVEIIVNRKSHLQKNIKLSPGKKSYAFEATVENPRLWWPAGYGEQYLYEVSAKVKNQNEADLASKKIGLRSLEVKRIKDGIGESYEFIVNNVPVFAKGANWIPADSFPPRVSPEKYEQLLSAATSANMNMLRVWGGGIYEDDVFYDTCDRLGILVWQDFMFSCAMYPADPDFLESVEQEITFQVRRLRHHPCMALWCGNNEIEAGWKWWNFTEKLSAALWEDYQKIFRRLLPGTCGKEDPGRLYWPSSPSSSLDLEFDADSFNYGDTHYWGIWHKKEPFEKYLSVKPRFASEYGFQSFPLISSVKRYTAEEDHEITSTVMKVHQRHPRGNQLIAAYMDQYYGIPPKFSHKLLLSQFLQAEGMKMGTEHFRRIRPHCMGSLFWQLNDCWPVASWSSIDYFGKWKALHYYARHFFAPVLVSAVEEAPGVRIYVISDEMKHKSGRLRAALVGMDGKIFFEREIELDIRPLESAVALEITQSEIPGEMDPGSFFLYCELDSGEEMISENSLFFRRPKDLKLTAPEIRTDISGKGADFCISLRSKGLARHVFLEAVGIDGIFSDNFFDLYPNHSRTVRFKSDKKSDASEILEKLELTTLFEMVRAAKSDS